MADLTKSVFTRAAEQGLYVGALFTLLYFCLVYCLRFPTLGLLAMMICVAVPIFIYVILARTYDNFQRLLTFSELWTQGIMIFVCATLIMAFVSVIHTRFIYPTFIVDYLKAIINALEAQDEFQLAEQFQLMLASNMVPSSGQFAMEFIWIGVFSGSLLSMFEAAIIKAFRKPAKNMPPLPPQ